MIYKLKLFPKIYNYQILDRVLMRLGVGKRFFCIIIFVEHVMGLLSVDSFLVKNWLIVVSRG